MGVGSVKKRTSKSASKTRKASSRSGTFEKTVITGSLPRKEMGKFGFVLRNLKKSSASS